MKISKAVSPSSLLLIASCVLMILQAGCRPRKSILGGDATSQTQIETLYPNTSAGQRVKEHMTASMTYGENAEAKYQESLSRLRAELGAADALFETYQKIPAENYLLRTMLIEGLKELRSPGALAHLKDIASAKIPPDRHPKDTEVDTRTDEVVIRITAVQGISILAANQSQEADKILLELIGHEDLTVRQMAARGFLQSSVGDIEEKIQMLRRKLPEAEHWYLTTKTTDIRQVQHPEMPKEFNLQTKPPTDAPSVKKP